MILVGLSSFITLAGSGSFGGAELAIVAVCVALGALYIWLGVSVRKLKDGSKIGVGVLSGLGLLSIPIGTIINGYILWLVFSAKGKIVFSDEYRKAVEETPHIKYRSSTLVKVFAAIVFILFAVAIGFAVAK